VDNFLCEIAYMQPQGGSDLYDRLMAVKPEGMSRNAWAVKAGVNRAFWSDVRKRGNASHATLVKLLDAAGVTFADFEARSSSDPNALVISEVKGTGMSAEEAHRAWRGEQPQTPVPLLGTAFGGEWSDGVEMTELHLSEVLDYVSRPQSVSGDSEAYAVEIVGESMVPRYEPGERAIVSPRAPVRPGDDVIVQLRGEGAEQLADRVTMILIKRLVRRTSQYLELRQFNPEETFRVETVRVAAVHRVMNRL
jgi:phage repressor protein C with HTH and peptisase S24 domain